LTTLYLREDFQNRLIVNGITYCFQTVFLLAAILQKHRATPGHGQHLLAAGIATIIAIFALRLVGAILGEMDITSLFEMTSLTASSPVQILTLLGTLAALMLIVLGFVVMAKEQTENRLTDSQHFSQSILNSMTNEIAVIDHEGFIVQINDAWRRFAIENSKDSKTLPRSSDVGTNYLDACQAGDDPPPEAGKTLDGIRAVLQGRTSSFSLEYDCHSPSIKRWFLMTVTPIDTKPRGAVIVHTNISDLKQAEEQIHDLAYSDTLTGLPNRSLLNDRMRMAQNDSKRTGRQCALMFLDLDNFKPLNDRHGHAIGDQLLVEVAERLIRCVREADTVARVGGDEFVVLLNGLNINPQLAREDARQVAEKIRLTLAEPYTLEGQDSNGHTKNIHHQCSASIGVVVFSGTETSQDDLLMASDMAMYDAKQSGRNAIRFAPACPAKSDIIG
jgi:diguanylate cyclase (GGDEF)-like protein